MAQSSFREQFGDLARKKGVQESLIPFWTNWVMAWGKYLSPRKFVDAGESDVEAFLQQLPDGVALKYGGRAREWGWQYVFPAPGFSVDPRTGRTGRHHLHEVNIQRAVRQAAREAGIAKTVTPHILRHSLIRSPLAPSPPAGQPSAVCLAAEPLGLPRTCSKTAPTFAGRRRRRPPCGQLDAGCLALLGCTVQELLGHSDVSTTMIY